MKLYSVKACEELMDMYIDRGGEAITLEEGCLGLGLVVCYGNGLKTSVITEVYINQWSSGHKIRQYNKCPKKYADMIEEATGVNPNGIEMLQKHLGKLLLPPVGYGR